MLIRTTKSLFCQSHPNLILTKKGVKEIRKKIGTVSMFDEILKKTKAEVDAEIEIGIQVLIPKDMTGGSTDERRFSFLPDGHFTEGLFYLK